MNKAKLGARLFLGLIFTVFGLNGFLNFLPAPPLEGTALTFMGGLAAAGYMFPLIKGIEVVAGIALLSGYFVPLALLFLAPIVVNIFLFHAVLAPAGLPIALLVTALTAFLGWAQCDAFKSVLKAK